MAKARVGKSSLEKAIAKWQRDPALFVRSLMQATPDPKQAEVMQAVADGSRGVAVKSGHGVGKTCLLSWLSVWWVSCWKSSKVRITAPTASQLDDTLLPEMKSWIRRMPQEIQDELYHVKAEKIEFKPFPELNFISAVTSRADQPDAMQGVHAENVLLIADEASGVADSVYEASVGSMSAPHACMVLAGNPVRNKGFFYDCFTKPGVTERWQTFTISCLDSPRVAPEFVEEQKDRYGEESNAYRIRVLGEFPRGDDDAVIPMHLVQAAINREVATVGNVTWGCDTARFGTNATTLAKRRGNTLLEPVRAWRGLNTVQIIGAVQQEWETTPFNLRPTDIFIDSLGPGGAGVVDGLQALGLPAVGINVSESPALKDRYVNLRSELWYNVREWFEKRDCTIPDDKDLIADLVMPSYRFMPGSGKIMVQPKANRGPEGEYKGMAHSPDRADALCLTFARGGAVALHGSRYRRDQPLKRNIKGLV